MPMSWMVMATLGLLMMAIFGHIRFVLYKRLQRAVVTSARGRPVARRWAPSACGCWPICFSV